MPCWMPVVVIPTQPETARNAGKPDRNALNELQHENIKHTMYALLCDDIMQSKLIEKSLIYTNSSNRYRAFC